MAVDLKEVGRLLELLRNQPSEAASAGGGAAQPGEGVAVGLAAQVIAEIDPSLTNDRRAQGEFYEQVRDDLADDGYLGVDNAAVLNMTLDERAADADTSAELEALESQAKAWASASKDLDANQEKWGKSDGVSLFEADAGALSGRAKAVKTAEDELASWGVSLSRTQTALAIEFLEGATKLDQAAFDRLNALLVGLVGENWQLGDGTVVVPPDLDYPTAKLLDAVLGKIAEKLEALPDGSEYALEDATAPVDVWAANIRILQNKAVGQARSLHSDQLATATTVRDQAIATDIANGPALNETVVLPTNRGQRDSGYREIVYKEQKVYVGQPSDGGVDLFLPADAPNSFFKSRITQETWGKIRAVIGLGDAPKTALQREIAAAMENGPELVDAKLVDAKGASTNLEFENINFEDDGVATGVVFDSANSIIYVDAPPDRTHFYKIPISQVAADELSWDDRELVNYVIDQD
jgi:hypothetical protein